MIHCFFFNYYNNSFGHSGSSKMNTNVALLPVEATEADNPASKLAKKLIIHLLYYSLNIYKLFKLFYNINNY